jgi:hypothetical protein
MGGKPVQISRDRLEVLYMETRRFHEKTNQATQGIDAEYLKLNDPSFRNGLSGGQGEMVKESISKSAKAISELKNVLNSISKFVDDKLAGTFELLKDTNNLGAAADKAATIAGDMRLKR